jgi:hypothetical protein
VPERVEARKSESMNRMKLSIFRGDQMSLISKIDGGQNSDEIIKHNNLE